MNEMKDITKRVGNVVARCKHGKVGLILEKVKTAKGVLWKGRVLEAEDYDCEYRILQIKNARLSAKKWQAITPEPLGFLPASEVKILLAGGTVSRP